MKTKVGFVFLNKLFKKTWVSFLLIHKFTCILFSGNLITEHPEKKYGFGLLDSDALFFVN